MSNRSRSSLFLMEQLIVIMVFAICAAACVKIFVAAYITTNDAKDMSNALLVAESGAECYKAAAGDPEKVAMVLGGVSGSKDGDQAILVYYDQEWQVCGEIEAAYVLRLICRAADQDKTAPVFGELSVEKITGEEIIAFTVAARGNTG